MMKFGESLLRPFIFGLNIRNIGMNKEEIIKEIFAEIEGVLMGGNEEDVECFNKIADDKLDIHTVQFLFKDWKVRKENLEKEFKKISKGGETK